MKTTEHYLRWYLRATCLGAVIAGLIPAAQEQWTIWGVASTVSFVVVILYGYSQAKPLEAYVVRKVASALERISS